MGCGAKKKLSERAASDGLICDPLMDMKVDAQSYDIERKASIFFDNAGTKAWTKAWFNGRENGEKSIEIPMAQAIKFHQDTIRLDEWLAYYYPKQMNACSKAVEQARRQILGY